MNASDVLCEIQTDKAVVALEADEDGKLAKIVKDKDAGTLKVESSFKFWREKNIDLFVRAQVGQLIAVMAEDGEDLDEAVKEAMANAGDEPTTAATQDSAEDGKTTHTCI